MLPWLLFSLETIHLGIDEFTNNVLKLHVISRCAGTIVAVYTLYLGTHKGIYTAVDTKAICSDLGAQVKLVTFFCFTGRLLCIIECIHCDEQVYAHFSKG